MQSVQTSHSTQRNRLQLEPHSGRRSSTRRLPPSGRPCGRGGLRVPEAPFPRVRGSERIPGSSLGFGSEPGRVCTPDPGVSAAPAEAKPGAQMHRVAGVETPKPGEVVDQGERERNKSERLSHGERLRHFPTVWPQIPAPPKSRSPGAFALTHSPPPAPQQQPWARGGPQPPAPPTGGPSPASHSRPRPAPPSNHAPSGTSPSTSLEPASASRPFPSLLFFFFFSVSYLLTPSFHRFRSA